MSTESFKPLANDAAMALDSATPAIDSMPQAVERDTASVQDLKAPIASESVAIIAAEDDAVLPVPLGEVAEGEAHPASSANEEDAAVLAVVDVITEPAAPVAEPIPDVSTLTAAKDAAAFVAQIFADPSISDAASGDVTAVAAQPIEQVVEYPSIPVFWPQAQAQHLQGLRVLVLGLGASGLAMARWCARASPKAKAPRASATG